MCPHVALFLLMFSGAAYTLLLRGGELCFLCVGCCEFFELWCYPSPLFCTGTLFLVISVWQTGRLLCVLSPLSGTLVLIDRCLFSFFDL